jgi:cell division transport system permease protein
VKQQLSKPARVEYKTGASQSKSGLGQQFHAWRSHHRIVAGESLVRLFTSPLQSLLTWLVVAIALALPAFLYLALAQLQTIGAGWQTRPQLSVFLNDRAREEAAMVLREQLLTKAEISSVEYISPEQALSEFEQYSGLGDVLASLDNNPLPPVLLVVPAIEFSQPQHLESLKADLISDPRVDDVRIDMEWVQRLQQMMIVGQRLVLALAALLGLGVLLVIGNTIRLTIENRRDEIVIVKLVGATNAFVRRPFLYTGFWYGLGGGVLACLLLLVGVQLLTGPIDQLADLYQSDFRLRGLNFVEGATILGLAAFLGLLGAAFAVSKHLHTIEPS